MLLDGRGGARCGLALLAMAACTHPAPVAPPIPPEGRTSFRALAPPDSAQGAIETVSESLTPAYASSDNRAPEYPPYALTAGCRSGTVPVRVYLGADGNVTGQRDIPERPLPSDTCHLAFRAAVQAAVNAWKFSPSFRMTVVQVPEREGQPGLTRLEQTPVAIYLDFEFFFEVVHGKGIVRSK